MVYRMQHKLVVLAVVAVLAGIWCVTPNATAAYVQAGDGYILAKNGGYGPGDGTGNGGSGPKDGTGNGAKKGTCSSQSVMQDQVLLAGKGKGHMYGPGDGTGNGGNGPKNGTGYGPGSCK